jgi:hypothetical protein
MIDSGYTVTQIQVTLRRVLEANGVPDGQVIVMPTALFVSVPARPTLETAVAAAGLHGCDSTRSTRCLAPSAPPRRAPSPRRRA